MRVVSLDRPQKGHHFIYISFDLEFFRRVQCSAPLNAKMPPNSSFFGSWLVFLFDEKLHYFGLDCGMLELFKIFYSRAVIQRTIVDSPAFLETGLVEKIAVCAHSTCLPKK
jgi:hypothetical protein